MLKKPTEVFKQKIANLIKNGADISEFLIGYDIKGLDLSNAIIKNLNRSFEDLSNTNFSRTIIGYENAKNFLTGCVLTNCNFKHCRVNGVLSFKKAICKNVNFSDAWMPMIEYQHADFTGANFCNLVMPVSSTKGHGAKISKEWMDRWGIKIV